MTILTYVGKPLKDLTDNELMELYNTPNVNGVNRTNIDLEMVSRLKPLGSKKP